MSAPNTDVTDRVPGSFTWIARSTNYGALGETLEFLDRLAGEPTLSIDVDEHEYEFHSQRVNVVDVGRSTESIELTLYPSSDLHDLATLGATDVNGKRTFNQEGDYRIWVMRNAEDTTPALDFAALDTSWTIEEVSLPNGPAELSLTGRVNGGFDFNPPAIK